MEQITRYDEYIITDTTTNEARRVAGYEMPNGSYILLNGDTTKVYADFQIYRRKLQDLLCDARLAKNKVDFVSGTTTLTSAKHPTRPFVVVSSQNGDWDTVNVAFVEASEKYELDQCIDKIVDRNERWYFTADIASDIWEHYKISEGQVVKGAAK